MTVTINWRSGSAVAYTSYSPVSKMVHFTVASRDFEIEPNSAELFANDLLAAVARSRAEAEQVK